MDSETYLKLVRSPSLIRMEIEALPKGAWIVIDEIQKLPILLNEVHKLTVDYNNKYLFALSGSSARKLKRMDANLLAGRAINRYFFPLTGRELDFNFDIDRLLGFGCLPRVCVEPEFAVDILEAYVTNYLKEEIQQEAFVKDFGSFSRFLEIAAICNGNVTNVANISRDAGVARVTVQRYFDVLETTLIGSWLPAWRAKVKIKEIGKPKFYFFDTGVVRALSDALRDPVEKAEKGVLLENLIFNELRAAQNTLQCGGKFYYWRTPAGSEVDFIWDRGKKAVGIEIKATDNFRKSYCKSLKMLIEGGHIQKGFVVYLGEDVLKDGDIPILPLKLFMKELCNGGIIG